MRSTKKVAMAALFAFTLGIVGCNSSAPTAPGAANVVITAISPLGLQPGPSPQAITVNGNNFLQGLTLTVVSPTNVTTTFSGGQVQFVDTHSFQTNVVIDVPGAYLFSVRNTSGDQSATFQFVVSSNSPQVPFIAAASPTSVIRSSQSVLVSLNGSNFDPNCTVTVVNPNAQQSVLQTSQLNSVTSTSVQFNVVFDTRGSYTVTLNNQFGDISNSVTIFVQ
ncbi:MAG: hypothetical protein ABI652_06355 [Acidobacteriota bacterium]